MAKLEMVAMGRTPEGAEALASALRNLLGCSAAHVVVKKLPETGDAWAHVYAPTRLAKQAHALIAAFDEGSSWARKVLKK